MERVLSQRLRFTDRRTGREFTCTDCRRQRASDRLTIPCDTGGLSACPYWRTHEASPGEPVAVADALALQLYEEIQGSGWELFQALRTFRLSEQEAEALYIRLTYLGQVLPALRQGLTA